jgi:hypothetical protein
MAEFYQITHMKLLESLKQLKDAHGVLGLKAEFEAEGATFREVMTQRIWTLKAGLPLHLKIGGVEAIRDIRDARDLEVDGIIAPMVESPFALTKFFSAIDRIYSHEAPHLFINLETITGYNARGEIFSLAKERITGVTIGRTDLCGSLLNETHDPNDQKIFDLVEDMIQQLTALEIPVTLGGTLTQDTLKVIRENPQWIQLVPKIETRKIVFDTQWLVDHPESLSAGLTFEQDFLQFFESEEQRERAFRDKRKEILSRRK